MHKLYENLNLGGFVSCQFVQFLFMAQRYGSYVSHFQKVYKRLIPLAR